MWVGGCHTELFIRPLLPCEPQTRAEKMPIFSCSTFFSLARFFERLSPALGLENSPPSLAAIGFFFRQSGVQDHLPIFPHAAAGGWVSFFSPVHGSAASPPKKRREKEEELFFPQPPIKNLRHPPLLHALSPGVGSQRQRIERTRPIKSKSPSLKAKPSKPQCPFPSIAPTKLFII